MRSQGRSHVLTVFDVGARHRHQNLHRNVCGDLAFAHLLLDRLREDLHQRQPARDPAHIAVEPPRQILEPIAEACFQLGQEPPLLEGRLLFREAKRPLEQQRLGLPHRPDHHLDRVVSELPKRRNPFEPVDHHIAVRLAGHCHHHDRGLLARFGQRAQ